ncbi:2-amino-4-hydroxy-6-hydroxymethyldihydropteridine diphosphokinase [Caldimonas thermodepolymerans]|jgi:2-amino-4-hydroxy-6-hydroxymethyldihydropteridine pyrophosphokinase|uniref:2-amino-4-hydroxy-6-hydroxymethyldihydropteridine pyrophosphokinase n=1 Tax=Caldimonas thermodepolymerans TaxID=215580 RepID=A0A2S5T307_9BURK|nr:2-amino-4-hydroxy-6-hydroxymethyldihydropteridine diphosphokinase [Caldimonas thermodepolymerans]PPE69381.1 2-amino-4-hydroxy-6-hydroxymethyldihydropteridine diphosphokinase [Caldimonas thermodepolymerans]QPC32731.1 2-amino-4-hydroxy-6-hydroxymethyldihydropteridine diphosphokinase [Caldimonas thermodepolymerans]RDI03492.1 2-amino-4-hydroxy-6-hydroxymethyldihydropteridine diphosphokinase [Caldimonas thermodepolymerans]TCP06649.1 2-amino-4-hydroxy-6-hydroxymethyldihydropteridine diphosphokinas
MVVAYVGLGANLGDALQTLRGAARALAGLPGVTAAAGSSVYRTAPVDAGGPDFLNAVVRLECTHDARTLFGQLREIEQRYGRERPYRNAPRTLDLDLLLWGDAVIAEPDLSVPHPRMHQRAFVLVPLSELDAAVRIPGHGTLSSLLAAVAAQDVERTADSLY